MAFCNVRSSWIFIKAFISPYGIESTEARRSKSFRIAEKSGVKCREARRSTTVDAWVANVVGAKKLGGSKFTWSAQ